MPSTSENNKRIAKNTLILFVRMLLMTAIGLYTSRVILRALGVSDYGIYDAVGGFVALFALLSVMLTNSINRFLTFELGKGDKDKLKRVFCTSVGVMLLLSAVVLVLGATVGVWFLNCKMNIPEGRMEAANVVLACSVCTFIFNLVSIPYNASIVAHEKMSAFAYISLVEATARLLIAYLIMVSPFDRLVTYAVLLLAMQSLIRLLYVAYCKRHFEECAYHWIYDKKLLREMTAFAGWNFLGTGASLVNIQGVNVMMNIFFGVNVNAARGIATQVNAQVYKFVTNFMMAMNPQITKSYAQGDFAYMHSLICRGAKFSFFLVLFFLIPLCLETRQVLAVWLGIVPEYAVPFVRLTLVATAMNVLSLPLITGLHATGNLKRYMIIVGAVEVTNFPITYIAFKLGGSPVVSYYIYLGVYFIVMLLRLYIIKGLIHMKASLFIRKVYVKVFLVSAVSCIMPVSAYLSQEEGVLRFCAVCAVSFVSTGVCVYVLGLDADERAMIVNMIRKKIHYKQRTTSKE